MRETPVAAAAYEEYVAMGPSRSLRKLVDLLHSRGQRKGTKETTLRHIADWNKEHNWQEKTRQYDKEIADEKRVKNQIEIDKMNEDHAVIGKSLALRAIKQIEALIKAEKFGSQSAVQLLKTSTDLERLARGAATERQEITGKDGGPLEIEYEVDWGGGTATTEDGEVSQQP